MATQKRRAVTIQVNGAEWLDLNARARDASVTVPAYVRSTCGLAAWLTRGAEMAGRASSARRPTLALERRSVLEPQDGEGDLGAAADEHAAARSSFDHRPRRFDARHRLDRPELVDVRIEAGADPFYFRMSQAW